MTRLWLSRFEVTGHRLQGFARSIVSKVFTGLILGAHMLNFVELFNSAILVPIAELFKSQSQLLEQDV